MIVIVKSGQLLVHYPFEFSEAVTKFVLSIHFVCLPENENVFELEDISMARKINQTLKIQKLEKKCSQNVDTQSIFSKLLMMKILLILLTHSGIRAKVKSSVAMLQRVKVMMNMRNARNVAMKVKFGYIVMHVINGTSNLSNLSHPVSLLGYINRLIDYINRLYYLLIICYVYMVEIPFS